MSTISLGIDVGGTSIKASHVDLASSRVLDRQEISTPVGGSPSDVANAVRQLATRCGGHLDRPVGICLPAVVRGGVTQSAANIDPRWIGSDAVALFEDALHTRVRVLNDADAAGLAEISALPASDREGVVVAITLGTGVGSALFTEGQLAPNTELGHLEVDGQLVDTHVAFSAIRREELGLDTWATRVDTYLASLQRLFSPARFIIGGGGSVYFDEISARLTVEVPTVRARFGNDAGIIGAAAAAWPGGDSSIPVGVK